MTTHIEWYSDHRNMATLWEWLCETGNEPQDGPVYFMEKPWKWNREYDVMLHVQMQKAPLNTDPGEVLQLAEEMGVL